MTLCNDRVFINYPDQVEIDMDYYYQSYMHDITIINIDEICLKKIKCNKQDVLVKATRWLYE